MKTIVTTLVCALTVISIHTQAQSKHNANVEEARKDIAASNAIYQSLVTKHDGSILDLYADDAWLLPAHSPALKTREEKLAFFDEAYRSGARTGTFTTLELFGDAKEYVTEIGIAKIYDGNSHLVADVHYMVLWKKTSKGWKMFRDMFSSVQPLK
jgi:ketosteroid isomerase-like protein